MVEDANVSARVELISVFLGLGEDKKRVNLPVECQECHGDE